MPEGDPVFNGEKYRLNFRERGSVFFRIVGYKNNIFQELDCLDVNALR